MHSWVFSAVQSPMTALMPGYFHMNCSTHSPPQRSRWQTPSCGTRMTTTLPHGYPFTATPPAGSTRETACHIEASCMYTSTDQLTDSLNYNHDKNYETKREGANLGRVWGARREQETQLWSPWCASNAVTAIDRAWRFFDQFVVSSLGLSPVFH